MVVRGYARRIEHDLTPQLVIAPDVAASGDPALVAAHCLAAIDAQLAEQIGDGDVLIVAGTIAALSCTGEEIEAAVLALQAVGVAAIVCRAATDTLVQLAGSYGLPVIAQPEAALALMAGTVVRIDLERGTIEDPASSTRWQAAPCDPAAVAATRRAALLMRMRRVAEDEGFME
jgi:3-isopropylmalate/(R)-2-methylmalate dehydratase small subunit